LLRCSFPEGVSAHNHYSQEIAMVEWKQWEGHVVDGRFPLRRHLGGSAHSAVFLTEYGSGTVQEAAIKLTPADPAAAQVWMLRRELAARLSHPGLLSIFQFGICQLGGADLLYVVMERSEEDLSQVVPVRPLTAAEAREMLTAILEPLAYLHAEGFVHGCLTPANIMAAGDRVKISSDALLRIGESADDLPEPNLNGPPEGRAGLTPAGDVWSIGMTVVEVLTQRAPAWDGSATNDPVVPESLESPFHDIARRCLRADPRMRCSLAEIGLALKPPALAPLARPSAAALVPAAKPAAPRTTPKAAAESPRKKQYLLPVAGAILAGVICTFAILTGTRLLSSPSGNEPRRAAPSEQAAATEKPATDPVTPVAAQVAPPSEDSTAVAPAPVPAPVASVPGTQHSAGGASSGEVVDRFVPEVPPQILRTIQGKVRVEAQVTIDPSGAVTDAKIDSRSGGKYFDRLALDAARRWKFKPTNDAGHAVVRFEFRRSGCEASSN
jgi:TonB family protein